MWNKCWPYLGLVSAAAALLLAACGDRKGAQPASRSEDRLADEAAAAARTKGAQDQPVMMAGIAARQELDIEAISGGWRVVASSRGKSALIGAIAEIHPESVNWSYRPPRGRGLGQLCREPVLQPLAAADRVAPVAGLGDAKRPAASVAPASLPHEMLCAGGGEFGPPEGAEVQLRRDGRLTLRWHDGEYLLLEKLLRPAPAEGLTREDYAADEARQGAR